MLSEFEENIVWRINDELIIFVFLKSFFSTECCGYFTKEDLLRTYFNLICMPAISISFLILIMWEDACIFLRYDVINLSCLKLFRYSEFYNLTPTALGDFVPEKKRKWNEFLDDLFHFLFMLQMLLHCSLDQLSCII